MLSRISLGRRKKGKEFEGGEEALRGIAAEKGRRRWLRR